MSRISISKTAGRKMLLAPPCREIPSQFFVDRGRQPPRLLTGREDGQNLLTMRLQIAKTKKKGVTAYAVTP